MSVARIVGNTVKVESKIIDGYDTYFIEGEGAAGLHAVCAQNDLSVSPLIEGSFHILRETVLKEQRGARSLVTDYICTAIRDAALDKDASLTP